MFVEKNGSKNTTAGLILHMKDFLIFIYRDGLRFESV